MKVMVEAVKVTEVQEKLKSRQEIVAAVNAKLDAFFAKREAVEAQMKKCRKCGQVLLHGVRVEGETTKDPTPTGPGVH